MKEIYAVKDAKHKETFKSYDKAYEFLKTLDNGKIKGFYSEKEALEWLEKPVKTKGIFVVFAGRVPGIYFTVADMKAQVEGFEGAKVGRAASIEKAQKLFANRDKILAEERKRVRTKKNPELVKMERIENLRKMRLKCKGNILCFIDCEANQGKAVSIGAVVYNQSTGEIIDTYYSLMKPDGFTKLDEYVKKLTGLSTDEIADARSFDIVNREFLSFLEMNEVSDIFSWSNNDKSFLNKNGKGFAKYFNTIKDLQPYISAVTIDSYYCKRWSLENIMYMFGIDKKVQHNALADALDLCEVFKRWQNKKLVKERMEKLISER